MGSPSFMTAPTRSKTSPDLSHAKHAHLSPLMEKALVLLGPEPDPQQGHTYFPPGALSSSLSQKSARDALSFASANLSVISLPSVDTLAERIACMECPFLYLRAFLLLY